MRPGDEFLRAVQIAIEWLDGRMHPLKQMVKDDPECDACVVARQFLKTVEQLKSGDTLKGLIHGK